MQFRAFLLQLIVALYVAGSRHAAGGGTPSFAGGIATNHLENMEILYKFDEILKDLLSINSTLAVQTARKYLNILRLNPGVISNITLRTADDISYNLGVKYINESHFMKEKPVTCGALEHLFLDYIVPMRGYFQPFKLSFLSPFNFFYFLVNKPVKTNSLVIDAFNEYKLDNNRVLLTNSQKLWQIYCNKYREHSKIKVRIYKNMVL